MDFRGAALAIIVLWFENHPGGYHEYTGPILDLLWYIRR